MSDNLGYAVLNRSELFGPHRATNALGSALVSPELWTTEKCQVQDRSTLSHQDRTHLEDSAFTYGLAPESYDVACSEGAMLRTPCGNGILNVHPDGRFWHIPGGMIAHPDLKSQMIEWLKEVSQKQRQTVLVYTVGTEELEQYRQAGYAINKFGEEPILDLGNLTWRGAAFEWVRRQTNFCQRAGLEVVEIIGTAAQRELATQLDEIHDEDLSDRVYSKPLKLLEGGFDPMTLCRRRLFLARNRDTHEIQGFMAASPMEGGKAWSFETYRKRQSAPRGTIPFLFREVIDRMQAEGVERVSLCLVPGKGAQHDLTPHSDSRMRWLLATWYRHLNFIFNTAGQDFFKSRFRPRYQDRYVCVYPGNTLGSFVSFLKVSGAVKPNLRNLFQRWFRGTKQTPTHD